MKKKFLFVVVLAFVGYFTSALFLEKTQNEPTKACKGVRVIGYHKKSGEYVPPYVRTPSWCKTTN